MGFEASSQEKELAKTVLSKIDTQVSDIVVRDHAYQIFTGAGLPNCTLDRIWDIADPDKNGSLKEDHIAKALRLIGWAQAEKAPEPALLERVGPLATIKGIPIPGVTLFGGMSNYQSAISSYSRPATQPSPNVPQHGQSLKVIPPTSGMCNSSRNSSSSNLSAQGGSCPKTPSSASSIYPTHSQRIGPVAEPANPTQIPEVQIGERPVGVPESKPSQDVTPGKARDESIRVEDTIAATTRSKWLEVERDMKRLTQGLSEEMSELKEEMSKMREEIATMRRHAVCINYSLLNTEKRLYGDKMGQPEDSTQEIQHGLGYPISTTAAELGPPHGERETSDPEMKGPLEQPIQNFAPMYSKIIFLFAICSVFLACFYFPRAPT